MLKNGKQEELKTKKENFNNTFEKIIKILNFGIVNDSILKKLEKYKNTYEEFLTEKNLEDLNELIPPASTSPASASTSPDSTSTDSPASTSPDSTSPDSPASTSPASTSTDSPASTSTDSTSTDSTSTDSTSTDSTSPDSPASTSPASTLIDSTSPASTPTDSTPTDLPASSPPDSKSTDSTPPEHHNCDEEKLWDTYNEKCITKEKCLKQMKRAMVVDEDKRYCLTEKKCADNNKAIHDRRCIPKIMKLKKLILDHDEEGLTTFFQENKDFFTKKENFSFTENGALLVELLLNSRKTEERGSKISRILRRRERSNDDEKIRIILSNLLSEGANPFYKEETLFVKNKKQRKNELKNFNKGKRKGLLEKAKKEHEKFYEELISETTKDNFFEERNKRDYPYTKVLRNSANKDVDNIKNLYDNDPNFKTYQELKK